MDDLKRTLRWRVAVWFCMAIAVTVLAMLPLLEALTGQSAVADALAGGGNLTISQSGVNGVDAFHAFERQAIERVTSRLGTTAASRIGDFGTTTPLALSSINGSGAVLGGDTPRVQATYIDHLGGHVELLAGQLPPEGLGGTDAAVTMPQAGADQLGLHLSDRICATFVGAGPAQAPWCARVVGLWRPVDGGDPIWGGSPPRLQVMLTGYDFFQLASVSQSQAPVAGVRYRLDPYVIDRDQLGQVAVALTDLRRDLSGSPLRLDTSLDRTLLQLDTRQRTAASTFHLITGFLIVLALVLVVLVSRRFSELHIDELGTLRQQGWGPHWLTGLLLSRLGTLAALALPAGLVAAAFCIAALVLLVGDLALAWLRPLDLAGAGAVLAGGLIVLGGLLWIVAHRAARGDFNPAMLTAPAESAPRTGRRVLGAVILGALGAAVLVAAGAMGPQPPALRSLPPMMVTLLPVAATALLAAAAMLLLPLTAWIPKRQRGELAGTLAGLQLEKRPDDHAWAAFMVAGGVAAGGLAARAVLPLLLRPDQVDALLPGWGFIVAVLAALGLVVVIVTAGYGLHFLGMARRRAWEYAALFTHDPPERTVGDSVGAEQLVVLRLSLVAGVLVGLALMPVAPRPWPETSLGWALAAAAVLVLALTLWVAAVLVGRPARHRYEAVK
jgi:hypothetical protein